MDPADDLGSLASVMSALASTPDDGPRLRAGDVIDGNYRVERSLGSGGMGVVYLARDHKLDRDVAIKVGRKVSADALAAHEHEARALAKLAHPNVVVVHAVGEVQGRIWLAMEYVAGGTLRSWLAAKPRGWREIVAMYAAAGDGLAAAHAAGLVHRDFKPDNVLVGGDGRPRVADFGIARSVTTYDPSSAGTPAYMAPEQRAGGDVDARADQYSFCVAVWEGLFGARPVYGRIAADPPAPAGKGPAHVVAALRRGLAEDPAARWPSIDALVRELRRDPIARRRRIAIVGGVAVVAIAAGALVTSRAMPAADEPCEDAPELAATWSAERRARTLRQFEAAGLAASGRAIVGSLDAYATRWSGGRIAACRATRVDGGQSEALLERRVVCLEAARRQLDATVGALEAGERAALLGADDLHAALPDLARCDDVTALANQQPLPSDPAARARIAAAQQLIANVKTTWYLRRDEALALAQRALDEARATRWQPIVADATWVSAQQQHVAGLPVWRTAYGVAATLALEAGNDETAAWSFADLAWGLGEDGDPTPARYNVDLALAIWRRIGSPPKLGVRIAGAEALAAIAAGKYDDALAATRRQVELARATFAPDDAVAISANHYNLAHALSWAGKPAEARAEIERAIAAATPVVGPEHPLIGRYLQLQASILGSEGRLEEALVPARRSLAIVERWYGPTDLRVSGPLYVLGGIAVKLGDRATAETAITRALGLAGAQRNTQEIAELQVNLAVLYVGEGKLERALALGTEALATQEAARGAGSPHTIPTLVLIGYVERALGHHERSVQFMERAVRATSSLARTSGQAINARIELANSLLAAGRPRDAAAALAPAIAAIAEPRGEVPEPVAAEAHLTHAEVLWAVGERPRARTAATTARDVYARLGTGYAQQRAAAEDWLAKHR